MAAEGGWGNPGLKCGVRGGSKWGLKLGRETLGRKAPSAEVRNHGKGARAWGQCIQKEESIIRKIFFSKNYTFKILHNVKTKSPNGSGWLNSNRYVQNAYCVPERMFQFIMFMIVNKSHFLPSHAPILSPSVGIWCHRNILKLQIKKRNWEMSSEIQASWGGEVIAWIRESDSKTFNQTIWYIVGTQ